jgi:hypothetical protein
MHEHLTWLHNSLAGDSPTFRRFGQAPPKTVHCRHQIHCSPQLSLSYSTKYSNKQTKMSSQIPSVDLSTPMKDPKTSFKSMIETISTQESSIRFNQFNAQVAWDLGSKIRSLFAERYPDGQSKGLGLVVRVELFNGLRLLECVVGDGPVTAPANLCVPLQPLWEE